MEVQLRPARHHVHPLVGPRTRRMLSGIGYTQPPDCTPKIPGAIPDPACITQLLAVQQANMAEHDEDQRQTFLANCNRDWATNDAQYAALGLPRPVNQCDAIYPASGRGAADPVQLAPVYMAPPPPAPIPRPTPAAAAPVPAAAPISVPVTAAPVPAVAVTSADSSTVDIGGHAIPVWVLVVAAGAGLYLMTRGR